MTGSNEIVRDVNKYVGWVYPLGGKKIYLEYCDVTDVEGKKWRS